MRFHSHAPETVWSHVFSDIVYADRCVYILACVLREITPENDHMSLRESMT
jgi:hypothetical protein